MAYRDSFSFGGFSLTSWVKRLLIANVAVFVGIWIASKLGVDLMAWLALMPDQVLLRPWTVVTYMFVHANFWHIFFNLLVLFFFGPPVEERLGSKEFIKFYLACGLAGAALSFVFAWHSMLVGASGAIYGVIVAFALFWPDSPIYLFGIVPVKAKWLAIAYIAFDLLMAWQAPLDGVAHFAHLGGAAAALLYLKAGNLGTALTTRARRLFRPRLTVVPGSAAPASPPRPARRIRPAEEERMLDDLDRVLDKISHSGMGSLTPEERKLLDEASKRYRHN